MGTFTGQSFISSNIDCGIWLSSFVQEPKEIGIFFQTGIVNLMINDIDAENMPYALDCSYEVI